MVYMKRFFLLILIFIFSGALYAQMRSLSVVYEVEVKYDEKELKNENREERAAYIALIDKKNENKDIYLLNFREGLYSYLVKESMPAQLVINGGIQTFNLSDQSRYIDFNTGESYSIRSLFGKDFTVKERVREYDWELVVDEEELIAGKLCKKAIFREKSGGLVIAWYCPEIPFPVGPNGYHGLLGLIMQLSTSSYRYTATEVTYTNDDVKMGRLKKAKIVTPEEFKAILDKKIAEYDAVVVDE